MTEHPTFSLDCSHFTPQDRILVACSGGADSMALLHALHRHEYRLVAGHINHGLRGDENKVEENFVSRQCGLLDIPYASRSLDFTGKKTHEAELREGRYAALVEMAREHNCPVIATGHTASDTLETVLLNLLRGAAVSGLCGIASGRELTGSITVVRPLLGTTRQEVRQWLTAIGQEWCEDSSNQDPAYLRNRVRNELLPAMAQLTDERQLAHSMERSGRILRDDIELLDTLARQELERLTLKQEENLLILDGEALRELPTALQRRVLREALPAVGDHTRDLKFERFEEVRLAVLENRRRTVWQWRSDLKVEWTGQHSGNRIRFSRV